MARQLGQGRGISILVSCKIYNKKKLYPKVANIEVLKSVYFSVIILIFLFYVHYLIYSGSNLAIMNSLYCAERLNFQTNFIILDRVFTTSLCVETRFKRCYCINRFSVDKIFRIQSAIERG